MTTRFTNSHDGTRIAYEVSGSGPNLVLVDGALCERDLGPSKGLSKALAGQFTVISYDRRGRGESTDAGTYEIERELQDLEAVVSQLEGPVFLFGQSSGAFLALDGAARMPRVGAVATYEAPVIVDPSHVALTPEFHQQLADLIAADQPGRAVSRFLASIGVPAPVRAIMHITPMWPKLKALAPTLLYDSLIVGEHQLGSQPNPDRWAGVRQRAILIYGGKSDEWVRQGNEALAASLPDATARALDGQTHNLRHKAVAPELARFFLGPAGAEPVAHAGS